MTPAERTFHLAVYRALCLAVRAYAVFLGLKGPWDESMS